MIISSVPNTSNSNNSSDNQSIRYIDLRNPILQWVILTDTPVNPIMQIRISNIAMPIGCVTVDEWDGVDW